MLIGVLVVFALTIRSNSSALSSFQQTHVEKTYCDGWEDGYCEGWKDVKGELAICPVTPVCPIPEVDKTRYQDGYNRGFKAGTKKAKGDE